MHTKFAGARKKPFLSALVKQRSIFLHLTLIGLLARKMTKGHTKVFISNVQLRRLKSKGELLAERLLLSLNDAMLYVVVLLGS